MKTEFDIEKGLVKITIGGRVKKDCHSRQILKLLEEQKISAQPAVLWDVRKATIQLAPTAFCQYSGPYQNSAEWPARI